MLLKNLRSPAVISAHFPIVLLTQQFYDYRVSQQSQVTSSVLSYEALLISSAEILGKTFYCAKRFSVVREEGSSEGLLEKESPSPPPEI